MTLWHFRVTHQNQRATHGHKEVDSRGGGPVEILKVPCECGHDHNLVGVHTQGQGMKGSGIGSVVPANDPGSFPSPGVEDVPSWDGSPTNEDEKGPGY
ncbi:MAG: hypothetical protein QOD33_682 [Pyrinomonadaceae bacterium]|jgi:hypothetical protein|nr:hypothetical protein [Pyrinomonadaceae bacterium]